MEEYPEHIINLLKQYLDGDCDEQANHELQKWLAASEENRVLFGRIRSAKILANKLKFYQDANKERDWKAICSKVALNKSSRSVRYWLRYAAILIFVAGGFWLYRAQQSPVGQVVPLSQVEKESVQPGYRQAYLELAGGERIRLGDSLNRVEKKIHGGEMKEIDEGLILVANDSVSRKQEEISYYTLTVPRGGEYQLTLADGTKVWMNSDSRLEFPPAFIGDKRLVRLSGEAFFEVKPDKKHPFVVGIGETNVVVRGTSFNIYAYENKVNTTLVNGLVNIQTPKGDFQLTPGYQAMVADGKVTIGKVDVYEKIAWKEGKFVFVGKRLEEVMTILARWYDLEVIYQAKHIKEMHFTGNIPRHASIREVLKFLERTNLVHFQIQEHVVTVTE